MQMLLLVKMKPVGRSREGAWIEIIWQLLDMSSILRRSREGAWIEMQATNNDARRAVASLP